MLRWLWEVAGLILVPQPASAVTVLRHVQLKRYLPAAVVSETGYAFDVSYIHEMSPIGYTASVSFRDYAGRESADSAAGHPMHRDTHRQQSCQVVPDPAPAGGGIGDAVVYPVALGLPGCSRSARVAVLGANAGNHS